VERIPIRRSSPPSPSLPPPPEISFQRPTLGSPKSRTGGTSSGAEFPTTYKLGSDRPTNAPPRGTGAQDVGSYGAELGAGITFAASIIVGFLIGQWIDHKVHDSFPWGTVLLGFAGIAAGFVNLFRLLAMKDRNQRK
jgi:hypothetical protein